MPVGRKVEAEQMQADQTGLEMWEEGGRRVAALWGGTACEALVAGGKWYGEVAVVLDDGQHEEAVGRMESGAIADQSQVGGVVHAGDGGHPECVEESGGGVHEKGIAGQQ